MTEDKATHAYTPAGFVLVRSPLLPFELYGKLTTTNVPDADWSHQTSDAQSVSAIFRDPTIREALLIASSSLESSLGKLHSRADSPEAEKIEISVRKYLARMAFRATPFGLFAGCSLGRVGTVTRFRLDSCQSYRRASRLDGDVVARALQRIGEDHDARERLMYRANATLRRVGGRFTYVQSFVRSDHRTNQLVAIGHSQEIEQILTEAAIGVSLAHLVDALCRMDVSETDARAFINELIDEQVLCPSLDLPLTSDNPLDAVALDLGGSHYGTVVMTALQEAQRRLARLDRTGLGLSRAQYDDAIEPVQGVLGTLDLPHAVQVDLWKPSSELTLSRQLCDVATSAVDVLHRTHRPINNNLETAIKAFRERFDREEVPLLDALDDETGIAFRWEQAPAGGSRGQAFALADAHLIELYRRVIEARARTLDLSDADIDALTIPHGKVLPDTCVLMGSLIKPVFADNDIGADWVVTGATGASGAQMLGRFCHLDDELRKATTAFLAAEESFQSDVIYAEIVHLAAGRLANVLRRPQLRKYEIPYLGRSSVSPDAVIPVTDLLLSVHSEEFILRSATRGCRVIPRLSNAHRWIAPHNLPVYQFLAALQSQGTTEFLTWDWGVLSSARWLPRLRFRRVILSRERWTLSKSDLAAMPSETPTKSSAGIAARLDSWWERNRLPEWAVMVDAGGSLPVRNGDAISMRWIADALRQQGQVRLEEMLPSPEQLFLASSDGSSFTHEMILPLVRQRDATNGGTRAPTHSRHVAAAAPARELRRYPPGSEWLYVKWYGGRALGDAVLREYVEPLFAELSDNGRIDRAFFVRYADPAPHLRIRVRGDPSVIVNVVTPAFHRASDQLLKARLIWKAQLDTYEREVERYGGWDGVEVAESLFTIDSTAVLGLVKAYPDTFAPERKLLALAGMHMMFRMFSIAGDEYTTFLDARSVKARHLWPAINAEHRRLRDQLTPLIDGASMPDASNLAVGCDILRRRSASAVAQTARLRAAEAAGDLAVSLQEIAASCAHMFLNRLSSEATSDSEALYYSILGRHVRGTLARKRAEGKGGLSQSAGLCVPSRVRETRPSDASD